MNHEVTKQVIIQLQLAIDKSHSLTVYPITSSYGISSYVYPNKYSEYTRGKHKKMACKGAMDQAILPKSEVPLHLETCWLIGVIIVQLVHDDHIIASMLKNAWMKNHAQKTE